MMKKPDDVAEKLLGVPYESLDDISPWLARTLNIRSGGARRQSQRGGTARRHP
jgi:hypothetical protein